MYTLLYQTVIPFLLSALIVILVTIAAERYGSKTGGILGTLPSTIIIAFAFIALNKGIPFAVQSVTVVPVEMGLNLLFLFLFALLAPRGILAASTVSLSTWALLTSIVIILDITNIIISLLLYLIVFIFSLFFLDQRKKIKEHTSINVHYTPLKILTRGLIAGTIIAIAVTLSNVGATLSGIFSVFPAIFLSTMIISLKDHGATFTMSLSKGMIYGSPSVVSYALGVFFIYPTAGILVGSLFAFLIALGVSLLLYAGRKIIQ